jgi:hypothetical protein
VCIPCCPDPSIRWNNVWATRSITVTITSKLWTYEMIRMNKMNLVTYSTSFPCHSFLSLSCNRSIDSSYWVLHTVQSSATSFKVQYPLVSSRSSSRCLRLLPLPPFTYILPSISHSTKCFRRQFLRKMRPIQSFFFLLHVGYSSPPWLYVTLILFLHDRPN